MPFIHDVIIVGAGPCGLGLATRFCEQTPADHYTDEEHRRYHWIRKNKPNQSGQTKGSRRSSIESQDGEPEVGQQLGDYHTVVIDATSDRFLTRWDSNFATFDIQHLRSPMFFHLDPADRDSLLAYAQAHDRYKSECEEIRGVVGQEISKHARKQRALRQHKRQAIGKDTNIDERERQDYFVPSRELFHDHCQSLIERYKIDEDRLIVKDVVADIQYGVAEDLLDELPSTSNGTLDKIFKVTTWQGVYYSRAVTLAIGPSMPLNQMVTWPESSCHSSQIQEFPSFEVQKKIRMALPTNVLIVGGGLTSAQLALRAIGKGVSHVYLIMRGPLKIKHFDMTLEWVGKFKNHEKATFWSADSDIERFQMLKSARGGGSIPLKYKKLLDAQIAVGKLTVCTHTTLRSICKPPGARGTSTVLTEPPIANLPEIDYVYFATGPRSGLNSLSMPSCCTCEAAEDTALPIPCLETMQREYPIHWLNGLPVLNHDLAWSSVSGSNVKDNPSEGPVETIPSSSSSSSEKEDTNVQTIPLFLSGALAALRLGPGAANLEGARTGAERVSWGLQDVLGTSLSTGERLAHGLQAYLSGVGGRFDGLGEIDE